MMEFPQSFDLRAIRAFVVVAETGGMTAAAKQLGLTQSSVSQIIANLETAVGTPLFDRSVRPLALTATGNMLLERGRELLARASDAFLAIREAERQPLANLTVGMFESFANTVGPLLVQELSELSRHWRVWSGISPQQNAALLSHSVDVIVTSSGELDTETGLERHFLMREPFVLVSPLAYGEPGEDLASFADKPFVRYSLRSAIGRQIERQLSRLRLSFPIHVEFDTAGAQLAAVANGAGWSMTTPLCLLQEQHLLPRLQVAPLTRGPFSRRISLVARRGDLGEVPSVMATTARRLLRERCLPSLFQQLPWLEPEIAWREE